MGNAIVLIGKATTLPGPTPMTPEATAFEYFHNRALFGNWTPRPPIEKWHPAIRKQYEAELDRLEREHAEAHRDRLKALEALEAERS